MCSNTSRMGKSTGTPCFSMKIFQGLSLFFLIFLNWEKCMGNKFILWILQSSQFFLWRCFCFACFNPFSRNWIYVILQLNVSQNMLQVFFWICFIQSEMVKTSISCVIHDVKHLLFISCKIIWIWNQSALELSSHIITVKCRWMIVCKRTNNLQYTKTWVLLFLDSSFILNRAKSLEPPLL